MREDKRFSQTDQDKGKNSHYVWIFLHEKSIIRRELKNTWHTNPSTLQNNGKINFFKDILYLHPTLKDSATSSRQMTKLLLRCKHIKWVLLGLQQLIDKIDYYW